METVVAVEAVADVATTVRLNKEYSDIEYKIEWRENLPPLFFVRPARTYSKGCKSLNRPDSGKVTAKGKGVRRETESEGSRRQTSGLTDRNPIKGLRVRIRLQKKSKSDNYPKSPKVNRADIRWKEYVHNWRGLAGERKRAVTTNCEKSAEAIVPA